MAKSTHYVTALTVAGSDCSGGAGIEADLKSMSALGVYGMAAITAVTAQAPAIGVAGFDVVSPAMVEAQIDACFSTAALRPRAVKTGMLADAPTIEAVARALRRNEAANIVADPVLVATSGHALTAHAEATIRAMRDVLAPLALLLTPNVAEARALTGSDSPAGQAAAFRRLGCRNVLLKGGDDPASPSLAVDLLWLEGRDEPVRLEAPRVATLNTHGTGCTLSAALASLLALGRELEEAVRGAKQYVTEAIGRGAAVDFCGARGPLCHQPNLTTL